MKITDLKENDKFTGFYLVREKALNEAKNGNKFINVDVCDDTGIVNGKVWDKAEDYYYLFEKGQIIKIQGRVTKFKGQLQLNISNLRLSAEEDEINIGDFLPCTEKDMDKMYEELSELLISVENSYLKKLIDSFMEDKDFMDSFKRSIAARTLHHNYIGGLLEHTLSVVKICDFFSNHYEHLDRELLITIAFLHDLGKIRELSSGTDFDYTVEGNLKGHLVIGIEILTERINNIPDFPSELRYRLEHAVVSHHGELEWGAPVVPKTPEAILLHYADNIDAKTIHAIAQINKYKEEKAMFTPYNNFLGRSFFKGESNQ